MAHVSNTFVLLNGKMVSADEINPGKHKYMGMFRPPVNPIANIQKDFMCSCGEILRTRNQTIEHYSKKGCFDIPQYIEIVDSIEYNEELSKKFGIRA